MASSVARKSLIPGPLSFSLGHTAFDIGAGRVPAALTASPIFSGCYLGRG